MLHDLSLRSCEIVGRKRNSISGGYIVPKSTGRPTFETDHEELLLEFFLASIKLVQTSHEMTQGFIHNI